VASLFVFAVVSCLAQSTSLPPYRPSPQSPLPGNSPSSLRKTGLEANGGSITEGIYTNSIFGFSLQIPPGWVVVPANDVPPITPVKGPTGATKPHEANRVLLLVTENAPFKQSYQRRSIQVVATRLTNQIAPATASGYLTYSRQAAKEQGLAVEYLGDPKELTIGGHKLSEIGLIDRTSGVAKHVEHYVTIDKNVLMQFMLVSPDEAGLKELQPFIQSLHFKAETRKSVTKTKK
jgi:hypothetical protein